LIGIQLIICQVYKNCTATLKNALIAFWISGFFGAKAMMVF
jgi:hypothetical protein